MEWIFVFAPTRRQMPVFMYGSEKLMDSRRLSVAVIEEIIRSILPVWSAGISPVKVVFWMTRSLCKAAANACPSSTPIPHGLLFSSVISNGG